MGFPLHPREQMSIKAMATHQVPCYKKIQGCGAFRISWPLLFWRRKGETLRKLCRVCQNKRGGMLTSGVQFLHDRLMKSKACWKSTNNLLGRGQFIFLSSIHNHSASSKIPLIIFFFLLGVLKN